MEPFMMENGRMIKNVGMEKWFVKMAMCTKENGNLTKEMEKESTSKLMGLRIHH